ncbi:hypothetical protein JEJ77_00160 [Klebsiella pneumoniae]|uniref:hypothetical protein n=1 Tax=Klebsiella pneumoniae TaxID=573 RepID=UPI0016142C30|nr:hypothetical protein [Klebsiella pneumoniae]MCD9350973.1 hypothetical protein [Klebsiella pneumoniae]MCQ8487286.1 hypothetical protein [Klebsiella pneumoniae]
MKSPITAEMTMALMPCLLISTSAITWPAERLPPDNNAVVVDELNLQPLISIVKRLKLNLVIEGEKNADYVSVRGRGVSG